MSQVKFIPVAFVPARVSVELLDAAAMIGMTAKRSESYDLAVEALKKRARRWLYRRGILPDEAGLFSVRKIEMAVAA